MTLKPNIFRAYDIRGIYPEEIHPGIAEAIARALVRFLRASAKKKGLNIVVGRDGRTSSVKLAAAFKKGILESGANVIDIGLVPTQLVYFTVWRHHFAGGVQITASHNLPEFNGFKLVKEQGSLIAANTGIDQIQKFVNQAIEKADAKKETSIKKARGKIIKRKVMAEYLRFNLSQFELHKIKPLKIAIDTANGVAGVLIPQLAKQLPAKIYHLFPEIDGTFPNHPPDPCQEENLQALANFVRQKKLDLGAAFDGDGDRIFFVDEKGTAISSSLILALMSRIILRDHPREKIVYTLCMSNIIKDIVKASGGTPLVTKIGFTFLKETMKKHRAIFGGEFSGHYAHRDHGFIEAPFFVLLTILKEISESGQSLSRLVLPFKKYFTSQAINLEIKDKQRALNLLEQGYSQGKISHLDGLRIDFDDWWFNARSSNTEDILRLVIEAKTKNLLFQKNKELLALLQKIRPLV